MDEWYYRLAGRQIGPIDLRSMKNLLLQGVITSESMVWKSDFGQTWRPVGETEIVPEPIRRVVATPPSEPAVDWYYEEKGSRCGPISANGIRGLLGKGEVSHGTLVWNSTFGQQWKALGETNIAPPNMPPPLPGTHVNDSFAWLLAAIPILGALTEKTLGDIIADVTPSSTQLFLIYAAINSVVALVDANQIEKSGRNTKSISLGIWFWLVPAYLFQRARALNQSYAYFWVWIASFVGAIYLSNPSILSGNTYWGADVPACNSSFAASQVKSVFKDIPMLRLSGIQALDVRAQSEVSSADKARTCRAIVLANNGTSYTVSYTIERRGDQIFTSVNIVP